MKCTAVFCTNEATTIIKMKRSKYRGRARCDQCVEEIKRKDDNRERPGMFTGKLEYIPIE
jgi:hypothetical protein